jgi:hypothetical protein
MIEVEEPSKRLRHNVEDRLIEGIEHSTHNSPTSAYNETLRTVKNTEKTFNTTGAMEKPNKRLPNDPDWVANVLSESNVCISEEYFLDTEVNNEKDQVKFC